MSHSQPLWRRAGVAVLALGLGGLFGAFAAALAAGLAGLLISLTDGGGVVGAGDLALFVGMAFVVAAGPFLIAALTLGAAGWALLHRQGFRSGWMAALFGGGLAGLAALLVFSQVLSGLTLAYVAAAAIGGAVAGLVAQRFAYGLWQPPN